MNKLFSLFIIVLVLVGCSQQQTHTASSWSYEMVTWHNHTYKVTSETVKTVDQQIGEVTDYSDYESASQTGTFSNKFPVGTKLFSIAGTDVSEAIAVEKMNGLYVKAVDQGSENK